MTEQLNFKSHLMKASKARRICTKEPSFWEIQLARHLIHHDLVARAPLQFVENGMFVCLHVGAQSSKLIAGGANAQTVLKAQKAARLLAVDCQ